MLCYSSTTGRKRTFKWSHESGTGLTRRASAGRRLRSNSERGQILLFMACFLAWYEEEMRGKSGSVNTNFTVQNCVIMKDNQSSQLIRLLDAGNARTKTFTSLSDLTPTFLEGVTCAFSKKISEANTPYVLLFFFFPLLSSLISLVD